MSHISRTLQRVLTNPMATIGLRIPGNYSTISPQLRWIPSMAQYSSDTKPKPATKEEIDKLVKNKKLVVFMKGVPEEPRCGFSNAVIQVLRMYGVTNYDTYDVLQNESIRQGIKEYSSWPTIPQIYINGQFVGGCDIFLEMHKSGELEEQFQKAGIDATAPPKPKEQE